MPYFTAFVVGRTMLCLLRTIIGEATKPQDFSWTEFLGKINTILELRQSDSSAPVLHAVNPIRDLRPNVLWLLAGWCIHLFYTSMAHRYGSTQEGARHCRVSCESEENPGLPW
ncbi:MAG: hypothetical protein MK102_04140 [Fuerstiella sp.]|nr:hypothetical protein [Fuerstiella sp.]